jgi:hypothetical protein
LEPGWQDPRQFCHDRIGVQLGRWTEPSKSVEFCAGGRRHRSLWSRAFKDWLCGRRCLKDHFCRRVVNPVSSNSEKASFCPVIEGGWSQRACSGHRQGTPHLTCCLIQAAKRSIHP